MDLEQAIRQWGSALDDAGLADAEANFTDKHHALKRARERHREADAKWRQVEMLLAPRAPVEIPNEEPKGG